MAESECMAGSRLKVEWANKHIAELELAIERFVEQEPYVLVSDDDAATGDKVLRVRVRSVPPATMGLMIGDVIHNLRSALDLLFWQLVDSQSMAPNSGDQFPVFKSKSIYDSPSGQGKVRRSGRQALTIFDAIKPYREGNEPLWQLHGLSLVDKHHVLIPVAMTYQSMVIDLALGPIFGAEAEGTLRIPISFPKPICPLEDNIEIARFAGLGRDAQPAPEMLVQVAFGRIGVAECEPVLSTLHRLSDAVDGILDDGRDALGVAESLIE